MCVRSRAEVLDSRQASDTYHVWIVWRGYLLSLQQRPVDVVVGPECMCLHFLKVLLIAQTPRSILL